MRTMARLEGPDASERHPGGKVGESALTNRLA
jgi:hypothetical protein